jgi:HAE1 family hydrophobic/amphiphilic exporter-1
VSLPRFSVNNPVAVNLLMWAIIVGGLWKGFTLVREFFPNVESEAIRVFVAYPGAVPGEIEKSIARPVEDAIQGIDDVDEILTRVIEGAAIVTVQLEEGADRDRALSDIRTSIDRVKPDLPGGAEEPEITELRPLIPVIGVVVYGDIDEERLREAAEDVRDDLLDLPEVSRVLLSGVRDREIWVEVEPARLEEYGLTFEEVGRAVATTNLDLPGGQVRSGLGNVGVRTMGETARAADLEGLVVRGRPDGRAVRLTDVAAVRDAFEDRVERGRFMGQPAVLATVFKTPEEDALEIADAVRDYVEENPTMLGGAARLAPTTDLSRFIRQRLDLMVRNARVGLILVLIVLALFLDLRVAFWVAVGLPVSFLGAFILMDLLGASINLISMLGMIVVLGLVVDDAIVIGENVFAKMREGLSPREAAIQGAQEMTRPVVAAILTTIAAFLPLGFISGRVGAFMSVFPVVVISALAVSLVEALVILPAHLGHLKGGDRPSRFPRLAAGLERMRRTRRGILEVRLPNLLERVLRFVLRWRYASMTAAAGLSFAVAGLIAGGMVEFVLLQDADAETVVIDLEMAAGTPEERTIEVVGMIERAALGLPEVEGVFSVVGTSFGDWGQVTATDPATVGQVTLQLHPADERERTGLRESGEVVTDLRKATAGTPGANRLVIASRGGGPGGPDLEIRVRGEDLVAVERAVAHVRALMGTYDGVYQIEDDLQKGKLEARMRLRESARALGLSTRDVALQLRHALFGFEAQDLQTEREEVTVRVLLPEGARKSLGDLGRLRIATRTGHRVPLEEVATFETTRGYASLSRVDGKRSVTVKAEVDETKLNVGDVTAELTASLSDVGARFPGVSVSFEGRKKDTRESFGSLAILFPIALLLVYGIIAVLFRSYGQPLIVMGAIPYGLVGAVLGHWIMGYPLTILSTIGSVALSGIIVNDSLILVDLVNRKRREDGLPLLDAVVQGARQRMRPILLTSITTIAGLSPLMLETSFQAQFLIPMAISIVFGLGVATVLTLVLLPTLYLVYEDVIAVLRYVGRGWRDLIRLLLPARGHTPDETS